MKLNFGFKGVLLLLVMFPNVGWADDLSFETLRLRDGTVNLIEIEKFITHSIKEKCGIAQLQDSSAATITASCHNVPNKIFVLHKMPSQKLPYLQTCVSTEGGKTCDPINNPAN